MKFIETVNAVLVLAFSWVYLRKWACILGFFGRGWFICHLFWELSKNLDIFINYPNFQLNTLN